MLYLLAKVYIIQIHKFAKKQLTKLKLTIHKFKQYIRSYFESNAGMGIEQAKADLEKINEQLSVFFKL